MHEYDVCKFSHRNIIISFLAAGKQCSGMRWREDSEEEKKRKDERGGTKEEVKERRRTPRIGDIPR